MATIQKVRFGDADVLVSVVQLPGTQETSAAARLRDNAIDALEQAQHAIKAVADSAAKTVGKLKAEAVSPATFEIELGLAFTAQGGVVVAGAGIEASIVVHLGYELKGKRPEIPRNSTPSSESVPDNATDVRGTVGDDT